jgi:DnaJ-domain-containing protein 1
MYVTRKLHVFKQATTQEETRQWISAAASTIQQHYNELKN